MENKNILDQIAEMEARQKKKQYGATEWIAALISLVLVLSVLYAIFKPKKLTAEEQFAKEVRQHTAYFKYDCEREIKSRLKSPDSYKQKRVTQSGDYEGVIAIQYTAKNSFGVELQEQAVCTYDYNGIVNIRM